MINNILLGINDLHRSSVRFFFFRASRRSLCDHNGTFCRSQTYPKKRSGRDETLHPLWRRIRVKINVTGSRAVGAVFGPPRHCIITLFRSQYWRCNLRANQIGDTYAHIRRYGRPVGNDEPLTEKKQTIVFVCRWKRDMRLRTIYDIVFIRIRHCSVADGVVCGERLRDLIFILFTSRGNV